MDWRKINLSDKDLFNKYLSIENYGISEFSFVNFYLYRDSFEYKILEDCLCTRSSESKELFLPLGINKYKALELLKLEYCRLRLNFNVRSLSQEMVNILEGLYPGQFTLIYDDIHSDYIYSVPELIELAGAKYHKKKTHINKFLKLYESYYVSFSPEMLSSVESALISWCEKRKCEDDYFLRE